VTHAAGAALDGDAPPETALKALEAAEDAAIKVLARDVELPGLEDLEQALADKRAARPGLLAGERERAARLARATADSRVADEALARALADAEVAASTPLVGIYPRSTRLEVEDLLHKASLATHRLNEVMAEGEGVSMFASFQHNIEQSKALLRQIAAHRASEMRDKAAGKGKR
jgi:hypothetical protein